MATSKPSKRRSVPVRLSEIPLEVRLAAARTEARGAKDPGERAALLRAALCPSDDVFYVTDFERAA